MPEDPRSKANGRRLKPGVSDGRRVVGVCAHAIPAHHRAALLRPPCATADRLQLRRITEDDRNGRPAAWRAGRTLLKKGQPWTVFPSFPGVLIRRVSAAFSPSIDTCLPKGSRKREYGADFCRVVGGCGIRTHPPPPAGRSRATGCAHPTFAQRHPGWAAGRQIHALASTGPDRVDRLFEE
jgi:hypothetical protein